MKLIPNNIQPYSHPKVESRLTTMKTQLPSKQRLNGKHDGEKNAQLQEPEFTIRTLEPVHLEVQETINMARQTLQPTARIFDANETRIRAAEKITAHKKNINFNEHKILQCGHEQSLIPVNQTKLKYGKWISPGAAVVSVADATLAYPGFRNVYPTFTALIASIATGIVIFIAHFFAGWVKKTVQPLQHALRFGLLVVISFALFLVIGNFRAQALNSVPDIAIHTDVVPTHVTALVSGWMIAIISEILFAAILLLSMIFWKNKAEREAEEAYLKKEKEIRELQHAVSVMKEDAATIEADALFQSQQARACYDYTANVIKRSKGIGKSAIQEYKKAYLDFHDGPVPAFFSKEDDHVYDESLRFFEADKIEQQ